MKPLGDHLGPNENIAFVVSESIDDILVGVFITRGVKVHAQHACIREELLYLIFDALRSETDGLEFASALRTDGRYGGMVTAVMTAHFVLPHMERHGHVALDTARRLAALGALDEGGITASVLEEDDLFVIRQDLTDAIHQRVAEMTHHLFAFVLTSQVNESDIR